MMHMNTVIILIMPIIAIMLHYAVYTYYMNYFQVNALIGTLDFQESVKRKGHLLQSISSQTLSWQSLLGHCHDSTAGYRNNNDNGVFVVSPDSVWYARVLLLFSASATTDTGSKSFECALVSTLETYDDPENGNCIDYITYIVYVNYAYYIY